MKKFVKNFWSLNVDEALVANWLRQKNVLGQNYEVFFPVNSQLPFVDLIIFNKTNKKTTTVQIKSSQSYQVTYNGKKYWASGHKFEYSKINSDKVDFFIFTCFYPKTINKKAGSRNIVDHYVVFRTDELIKYVKKFKKGNLSKSRKIGFSFYIWPPTGELYEDWELKKEYVSNDYEKLEPLQEALDDADKIKQKLK